MLLNSTFLFDCHLISFFFMVDKHLGKVINIIILLVYLLFAHQLD